ncbi:MAG: hypothetical protein ABIT01_14675 [Thermoanaerobaculia bacterium]
MISIQVRPRLSALVISGALLFSGVSVTQAANAADGALLETTVDVPREHAVNVDLTFQQATITTVETHNDPKSDDVKEAREKDPTDHTMMLIRFRYKNADYTKHKVKLRVVFLDEAGAVVGDAGRTGTLDAGKMDDTITFPMRVKTLDWPRATKLKVIASFLK